MQYLIYTYVDAVTGVSVMEAPARNGPRPPDVAGLTYQWARESEYPTDRPTLYGTAPDGADVDVPGVLGAVNHDTYVDHLLAELSGRVATHRWRRETGGFALAAPGSPFDGAHVRTDEKTELRIGRAARAVADGRTDPVRWQMADRFFVTLGPAEITAIDAAITAHIEACFARHDAIQQALTAAATAPDATAADIIATYDAEIGTGWPGTEGDP